MIDLSAVSPSSAKRCLAFLTVATSVALASSGCSYFHSVARVPPPGTAGPSSPASLPVAVSPSVPAPNTPSADDASGPDPEQVRHAVRMSADYLVRACGSSGRFVYQVYLDPAVGRTSEYNIVRHAGAVYALAAYAQTDPREDVLDAIRRAAKFLARETLRPVSEPGYDMLAVWSDPDIDGFGGMPEAKLGGTGLGLVALLGAEKVLPGTTPREDLRAMGRFILFMQKKNGQFYWQYAPQRGGRDDSIAAPFYPGEAALGLLMLYEADPSPEWLQAAADALGYLARQRADQAEVEADHWALLATARLLPFYGRCPRKPVAEDALIAHAAQICDSILAQRPDFDPASPEHGALVRGAYTCPTGTYLEGLLAAYSFLPDSHAPLKKRIRSVADQGIAFLLRSQIASGPYAGGMPGAVAGRGNDPDAGVVRIDYVQHALCAMMAYLEMRRAPAGAEGETARELTPSGNSGL